MSTTDVTFDVLKHNLSRYLPIRVVLRRVSNTYTGLIENSFSMDFSDSHVRIWWSGQAYSVLGEHIINGIDDAKHNAKPGDLIIDPLAEDSPIEVDWAAWEKSTNKFDKRNAPFKIKALK